MTKFCKKLALAALVAAIIPSTVFANGASESQTSGSSSTDQGKSGTITLMCESYVDAGVQAVMKDYQKDNPQVKIETIVATDTDANDTNFTTKCASQDLPDMLITQVKANIAEYAKNGYIIPLDDTGIANNLIKGDQSLLHYDGSFYGVPMSVGVSGVIVNLDALDKYGVSIDPQPQSIGEFVQLCQKLRDAGMEYPIAIGAKDAGQVTAFVFQYVYQNVYGEDPNWYANVLRGKTGWNGPEFMKTFDAFGKLKPYANKDALGCDKTNAMKKIIMGDAAFYFSTGGIKDFKQIDPEINLTFIAPPFADKPQDLKAIINFDAAFTITSQAKDPELCKDFLKFLTTPEEAAVFSQAIDSMPTILGTKAKLDPAYDNMISLLSSGIDTVPMLSRQWIPGIKAIMKKGTQDWYSGKPAATVGNDIEGAHQRLMKGNPDFVTNFLDTYTDIK